MTDTKQSIRCLKCKNIITFTPKLGDLILMEFAGGFEMRSDSIFPRYITMPSVASSKDGTYCKTCDHLICIKCGMKLKHSSAKCSKCKQ